MELNKNTVDLYELLHRENGEILYEGAAGCIVRTPGKGTVMSDITDGAALREALRELHMPELDLMVVKSEAAVQTLRQERGFTGANPCTQWCYMKKEPPVQMPCEIRPLTEDYAAVAGAQYHHREDYIQERISSGRMWGLFENGALAGFIGVHTEGAMGMLEIFPDFRRRGYGYALEAWLIAWHLAQCWTPYCHVVAGNDASAHLQHKLGLEPAEQPAIWTWRED